MRQRGRIGLLAVLAGSVVLAAAGAVTAYQELGVFSTGSSGAADRYASLAQGIYHDAPSLLGKRMVLDACVEAIGGAYGREQDSDSQSRVLEHCRAEADTIAAEAPSLTYAHAVGALAAARLGDFDGFNTRMLQAQITGPTEQAQAEWRAAVVETYLAEASPDVLRRHEADLRLLVASDRGIASISQRYVGQPDFRERITAIVETMPPAAQARFVSRVRAAAAEATP